MARIRTIKPDFWTDERLSECSVSARLLFIGTWNFADDNGNLPRSAKKIKMQVFPADSFDCEPLIQELMAHGILVEYSVNGEKYLHIKNFKRHQVINRPSKSNIPDFNFTDPSVITHAPLIERSLTEGKGREGKGKEKDKKHIYVGQSEKNTTDDGHQTHPMFDPDALGESKSLAIDPNPDPDPESEHKAQLERKRFRQDAIDTLEFLNVKTGRTYQPVDVNLDLIMSRLREGYEPIQLRRVIIDRCNRWQGDEKMREYLRPATIFNKTKFSQYVGELQAVLPPPSTASEGRR